MTKIGNGSLRLPLFRLMPRLHYEVFGGPYPQRPMNMVGVKMAEELPHVTDIDCPTRDFSVPDVTMLRGCVLVAMQEIVRRKPVYVGCMGGRGRTGLFLAVLVKAFGIPNPVEYVRQHYYPHAVETRDQYDFVSSFAITPQMNMLLRKARLKYGWRLWMQNLTKVEAPGETAQAVLIKSQPVRTVPRHASVYDMDDFGDF